jgi:Uma2 family endonuclease
MSVPKSRFFSPEEYLTLERTAATRSEYLDGVIYDMVGSSPEHSLITANVSGALWVQLKGKPCQVFSSDMKVRTDLAGLFAYPDVTVVCGEPVFHDERRDVLVNPKVIIEVLSPSTEGYDRGEKFAAYRGIASLLDYLLIAQDAARVEHYTREGEDRWVLTEAAGLEARVEIASIDCVLALEEVYEKVTFRPARG